MLSRKLPAKPVTTTPGSACVLMVIWTNCPGPPVVLVPLGCGIGLDVALADWPDPAHFAAVVLPFPCVVDAVANPYVPFVEPPLFTAALHWPPALKFPTECPAPATVAVGGGTSGGGGVVANTGTKPADASELCSGTSPVATLLAPDAALPVDGTPGIGIGIGKPGITTAVPAVVPGLLALEVPFTGPPAGPGPAEIEVAAEPAPVVKVLALAV